MLILTFEPVFAWITSLLFFHEVLGSRALLGAALLGYLLATHLAESVAAAGVLRRQLPVLAAGLGLLVLATGAALLPSAGSGLTADWLRVLAAAAAIMAAALALPV